MERYIISTVFMEAQTAVGTARSLSHYGQSAFGRRSPLGRLVWWASHAKQSNAERSFGTFMTQTPCGLVCASRDHTCGSLCLDSQAWLKLVTIKGAR